MSEEGKVVRRRIREPENSGASKSEDPDVDKKESDTEDVDSKETRLTLMEEVLLLGLKDKEVSAILCIVVFSHTHTLPISWLLATIYMTIMLWQISLRLIWHA